MIKDWILTVVLTGAIITGCVPKNIHSSEPQKIAPLKQQIDITVRSEDGSQLSAHTEEQYKKSESPEIKLSAMTSICFESKIAFMKLYSGLSVSDVTHMWNDFTFLEYRTDIRNVYLFINSPGGDAFSGLALSDQIERAKSKGFHITAYASGIIASAAVPVFAVTNERYAAPGTIFMVHEAALWKWPGRETASDIRSQNELMGLLRERYIKKLTGNSDLSKVKWMELETKTTWFSVERAFEWGLVDVIQ
jgi:ATP-dependent protease ClpP protease subunit